MERVGAMLVDDRAACHGTSQLREGAKDVVQESDEQQAALAKRAGRGLPEIEVEGTQDDGNDDVAQL